MQQEWTQVGTSQKQRQSSMDASTQKNPQTQHNIPPPWKSKQETFYSADSQTDALANSYNKNTQIIWKPIELSDYTGFLKRALTNLGFEVQLIATISNRGKKTKIRRNGG